MSTYAWILLATIIFPLLLSFDRKVAFYRDWPRALLSTLIVGLPFLAWDALATTRGDWSFSASHTFAGRVFGLPIEEILFFLVAPFSCVFIYRCLQAWLPEAYFSRRSWPWIALLAVAALGAAIAWPRFYTGTILAFVALLACLVAVFWQKYVYRRNFWLAQAICLVPFLIVNGFLAGLPVVMYSPAAILGPRLFSIPIEDFFYSFVLVGANILVFESLRAGSRRRLARKQVMAGGKGQQTAIVVGAGLSGLAVAARLARQGWQVSVYESTQGPGGKAGSTTLAGYRFDTGPSMLTMPQVFDRLFADCGENRADHLEFVPLPEICAYFWQDGLRLNSRWANDGMAETLAEKLGEDPAKVKAYFRRAQRIYKISAGLFLERSLHQASSYLGWAGLRGIFGVPAMALFTTMHRLHRRYFKHPHTIQLFDRLATYNGSNPYRTPGTLSIIAHSEYGLGGYAVKGGIRAIPLAIEGLAKRQGVAFHYGSKVEKILVKDNRACGVVVGGETIAADLVVSNSDVERTYKELLDRPRDRWYRRQSDREPSSSGMVFYWGIKASFPELKVNNIFFSADYAADFQAIFTDLRCPDDPTVYINITSKVDAEDAVPGGENWFVYINSPHDTGQDWAAETKRMRAIALGVISRALGRDIEPLIAVEQVMTPRDLALTTGSPKGSLFGIASNSRGAAFLRHPNRHPDIDGLYFCGGSAHPGGGMPIVLQSAHIVAGLVARYEEKKR